MTTLHPFGRSAADLQSDTARTSCSRPLAERSRLTWWLRSGGDPAQLLADFLADAGLSSPDLSDPGGTEHDYQSDISVRRDRHADGPVCGAAVLISAAGCAALAGAPGGPPSPVPAIPDLLAVGFGDPPAPPRPPPYRDFPPRRWEPSWAGGQPPGGGPAGRPGRRG